MGVAVQCLFSVCQILMVLSSEEACENCLRKCCPEDEALTVTNDTSVDCVTNNAKSLRTIHNITPYNIIYGKTCQENTSKIFLDPTTFDFALDPNGKLQWEEFQFDHETSCVDSYNGQIAAIACVSPDSEEKIIISVTGMIISIPFLLATFIAYALLPDRNLHMKALMFYVINLMSSYIILVVIQLSNSRFEDTACALMGYFCLFFFLVSFLWMNVICVDIWFTFSGLRGFSGSKKIAERKRFLIYCCYAWGVPVIHVLGVYAIDRLSNTNAWYHPGIGVGQCFLKRGYQELLYFHGPMAILITINIILFAITAIKIRSIKKDTSVLKKEDSKRHSYENDKQTFNLYLKLLFAMGVNWSMEIISWAVNWAGKAPDGIWYLTDFCNAIYGVFIFFIFVFKKNIWKLLKKRYYSFIGKPHLAHSMTVSNTTRATSYSTANTSINDHPHGVTDTSTLTSEA